MQKRHRHVFSSTRIYGGCVREEFVKMSWIEERARAGKRKRNKKSERRRKTQRTPRSIFGRSGEERGLTSTYIATRAAGKQDDNRPTQEKPLAPPRTARLNPSHFSSGSYSVYALALSLVSLLF